MTKQLLLGVWVVLLAATAWAQDAKPPKPPKYCNPCLFYGGDSSGTTEVGLANEQDVLVPNAEVFVPFDVPKTQEWQATGLLTNNWSTVDVLDPQKAVWSISTGIQQGKCGPALVSGNSSASFKPTGRSGFGENEYTTLVKIKGVKLKAGRYWLTTVPECTKGSSCASARYLVSNFVGKGVDAFGPPEPCNQAFFDSTVFGSKCTQVAGQGCGRFSAGVLGTK